jgi:hypothetical protein
MAEFESYAPGTPSWVDLASPDVSVTHRFYGDLFGWDVAETGPDMGGYAMFTLKGRNVAGVMPSQGDGQPAAWSTYVSVADADATIDKVRAAGGTVLVEPTDVPGAGRMAVFVDVTGAALGLWQPDGHPGAGLANEPGAFCWNELQTRDTEAATAFYRAVFGWDARSSAMGDVTYTEWHLGEPAIGGMLSMPAEVPAEVPAYWLTYFAVEDCDAALARAVELGATTLVPPMDVEPGRFAVLTDPTGAAFAVIAMPPAG